MFYFKFQQFLPNEGPKISAQPLVLLLFRFFVRDHFGSHAYHVPDGIFLEKMLCRIVRFRSCIKKMVCLEFFRRKTFVTAQNK